MVGDFPDFFDSKVHEKYDELSMMLKGIEDDCCYLADSGEHPEWHNYDMAATDARTEMYEWLLDLGYVRVGYMSMYSINSMHFELHEKYLEEYRPRLIRFAKLYDMKAVLEPRK